MGNGEAFAALKLVFGATNDSYGNDENRLHFGWGEFTIDDSWCDQPDFFAGIISYVVEVPEPATVFYCLVWVDWFCVRRR